MSRINDIVGKTNTGKPEQRITCFDWVLEGRGGRSHGGAPRVLAVKADGSLDIKHCSGPIPSFAWGSRNEFAITYENDLQIMKPPSYDPSEEVQRPQRRSILEIEDLDIDEEHDSGEESPDYKYNMTERPRIRSDSVNRPAEFLLSSKDVLKNDICVVMRRRVESGYLMDCAKNAAMAKRQGDQYLEDMWVWLDGAQECAREEGMMTQTLNLSFLGG